MKELMRYLEENYPEDPIVFQWSIAKDRNEWSDEEAIKRLISSLISNKNMAIKAFEKKNKGKVLEFKK